MYGLRKGWRGLMRQPYSLLLNAGFQHIFYFIDRSLKIQSKKNQRLAIRSKACFK